MKVIDLVSCAVMTASPPPGMFTVEVVVNERLAGAVIVTSSPIAGAVALSAAPRLIGSTRTVITWEMDPEATVKVYMPPVGMSALTK